MFQPRSRFWVAVTILLFSTGFLNQISQAAILGVTASPKRTNLSGDEDRTLNIRWVISTDPAHQQGATSAQGVLKDTTTNTVLKTFNLPLNTPEGSGPIHFEEALTLTAEDILTWREAGYQELEYNRLFSFGGDIQSAQKAWIAIAITTPKIEQIETLVLQNTQLNFKPQRFNRTVALDLPLHAQLTINYSGLGVFSGYWQIARLNPETQTFNYQLLAEANKTLEQRNQDFLLSPRLPTDQPGLYRVRFCPGTGVLSGGFQAVTDNDCPESELSAALEYKVVQDGAVPLETAATTEPLTVNTESVFEWIRVPNAVVYELLIHQVNNKETVNSDSFVSRLLIRSSQKSTQLTPETFAQLKTGVQYTWQVNAFDTHGELISQTPSQEFIYMPQGM